MEGNLLEWDFSISYFLKRFKHVDYYVVYSLSRSSDNVEILEEKQTVIDIQ